MSIIVSIPDDTHALLHHLAEENDPMAICVQAIIDALNLDPSIPAYSASAEDLIETASVPGSSATVSRGDHKHTHGNRTGGSLHAAAIAGGANGFLTGADKTKLDGVAASAAALTSSAPVAVTSAAAEVGDGTTAARNNHKHAVAQAGAGAEGLMSAAHYNKLEALPANISPALTPATLTAITSITFDAYGRITAISGT